MTTDTPRREAFEKWGRDAGLDLHTTSPNSGWYADTYALWAWQAWEASAALTPPATAGDARKAAGLVCRDVAELSDRTSPDDAPDMMLATTDELTDIILRHFPPSAEAKPGLDLGLGRVKE